MAETAWRLHRGWRFAILFSTAGILTVVDGCGGGSTPSVTPTITSVSVVCSPTSILTTQTSACTPTVSGSGAYSSTVNWSVSPTSIGAVSSAGVFTPAGAGTATITATSTQDTTKSGIATVIVTAPPTITSVVVVCSPTSILTTQTSACTPTVSGSGAYSSTVNWSVSPTSIGAVSSAGVFTPAGAGTATITATSTQDTTKFGNATVTVTNPAPTISSLSPATVTPGAAAQTLTINGTGFASSAIVTYDQAPHAATFLNSTQLTIFLSATDQATAGTYAVVVSNPSPGGGASNSFTFTIMNPCGSDPQSQTVTAPSPASFCVASPTTGSASFQWYKNGAAISGATSAAYTTPVTSTGTNGAGFSVTVKDGSGTHTSATAVLTVNPAPTVNLAPVGPVLIGGWPLSQMVTAGERATFTASAIGTPPISYQWSENGTPIPGAASATYTTPISSSADNGESFTVTVSNSVNSLTSTPATLTVNAAPASPSIQVPPNSVSVTLGNTALFSVIAAGSAPLAYQWSKNGTPINGATDSTYTAPPTTSADNNAQLTVTITNSAGSITSSAVLLLVTSQVYGLGGFQPVFPYDAIDLTGVRYRFQVATNESKSGKIVFDNHTITTPGSAVSYNIETNIYSGTQLYTDGGCTTWPLLGSYAEADASLRNATPDYPFSEGLQPAVGSSINSNDSHNWPIQTYLIDNLPNTWKTDSISQFGINGLEALVTIQQSGTLTDITGFRRCGLPMLSGTYRIWTITTQVTGYPTVVNQVIAPDADARYLVPWAAMDFYSEFLNGLGTFSVQFWDFAYMRKSNPAWAPAATFLMNYNYDGSGDNFGVHVVSVGGQDRIEFSNVLGNSYLPPNLRFAITPP